MPLARRNTNDSSNIAAIMRDASQIARQPPKLNLDQLTVQPVTPRSSRQPDSVRDLMRPRSASAVALKCDDLREEAFYSSRRREPLARGPHWEAPHSATTADFAGFGVPTLKLPQDTTAAAMHSVDPKPSLILKRSEPPTELRLGRVEPRGPSLAECIKLQGPLSTRIVARPIGSADPRFVGRSEATAGYKRPKSSLGLQTSVADPTNRQPAGISTGQRRGASDSMASVLQHQVVSSARDSVPKEVTLRDSRAPAGAPSVRSTSRTPREPIAGLDLSARELLSPRPGSAQAQAQLSRPELEKIWLKAAASSERISFSRAWEMATRSGATSSCTLQEFCKACTVLDARA